MPTPIHGGDIYTAKEHYAGRIIDFSANINPLGVPKGVQKALCESIAVCDCYPDPFCRELTDAIAVAEGILPEWVLCGNGASDVIYRLAFALRPKIALLAAPCFAEYEQALLAADCSIRRHILQEQDDFVLTERILDDITPQLDLLFLCTPNNPTGQPIETSLLERILTACEENNVFFALDECFIDFLDEPERYTLKHRLVGHPNLMLFRAFTKLYAIPGVRLGQCYCSNTALLEHMYTCGSPWSVSVLAQAAGGRALCEKDYVTQTHELIHTERAFLKTGLTRLGCKVVGSHANYIFFKAPHTNLQHLLSRRGILLRSCDNYAGLSAGWLRAAVRAHDDNVLLLQAMEEVLVCH